MMLGAELQITNMFGNTFLHSFDKDPLFATSFIVQHASVMMSIHKSPRRCSSSPFRSS